MIPISGLFQIDRGFQKVIGEVFLILSLPLSVSVWSPLLHLSLGLYEDCLCIQALDIPSRSKSVWMDRVECLKDHRIRPLCTATIRAHTYIHTLYGRTDHHHQLRPLHRVVHDVCTCRLVHCYYYYYYCYHHKILVQSFSIVEMLVIWSGIAGLGQRLSDELTASAYGTSPRQATRERERDSLSLSYILDT